MKTRTRRAGGGLAAELAGLANPAPVSTELPDDDFDPTGGAVAREADRDDATSSDDSDADANAFGDDDEGVFVPTKADRATVGKGKLRMRAGIAIDDGEYVGKSSSRAAMEGAWAGEEDERDESDESDDASDDHAMVTDSDDKSDSDETNDDDDDDGESEEASEEENMEEDDASDSESQSESDSDGEGAFNETSAANALEAELAAMRAEEAEANRLLKTKSQNVAKGAAVRTQNACWERSLRTRIVLQKGLTLAAKMPKPEYAAAMRDADKGVAPALAVAAASARGALDALLRLQAALMDGNPAIGEALREGENDGDADPGKAKKRKTRGGFYAEAATLDLLSKPAAAVWRAADAAFSSYAPFRDQSCDRWHRKAQVTSGKTGGVGSNPGGRGENQGSALRAFDQSLSQQVRAAMRPPDRLVNRSRPPAHLAPRRLGEPEMSLERKEKNHDEDGFDDDVNLLTADARGDDRVAEVYEDADFYEQALKEFLETRGAGSNLGASLGVPAASQPPKRRKQVDRRASKGRKLRYHVQQPLVNFCAPVELEVPGWAEKVFTRLFASSA